MNGKNYTRILAVKNDARLELFKNEYANYIEFNPGNSSPNIRWNPSDGIQFSSGKMTSDFISNIEFIQFLAQIFWEYPTNKLEVMGYKILICA